MTGQEPLATFRLIPNKLADQLLVEWGHWLGACRRPFGRQSFGLEVEGVLVSVAVSASTVGVTCGGYRRKEVVELARCCSHPDHRWATRVALRLWREIAPRIWAAKYWPVVALVSYSDSSRHTGDLYRFDGWTKVREVPGGVAGGGWQKHKKYAPKAVWVYPIRDRERTQ